MAGSTRSPARKKVEDLLHDEIRAAKEVISLQQIDNHRYQDHVKILDAEIDSLRELLNDKQDVINAQREEMLRRDDLIGQLEQELHDNRVERHALKTFEQQNILLLEELRETKERMEELEVEVRFLRDLKDQRTEYDETKMKMVAEMDVKLNGHNYEYKYS